jgi:hypothetical protein
VKRNHFQALSLVISLGICASASAGEQLSPPTKIISVYSFSGANVLKVEVDPSFYDPAGCGSEFIDVQLDAPDRSAEEQRELVDSIHAAFLTSRNIYFLIRDDICSQRKGAKARLAVGVRVHAN